MIVLFVCILCVSVVIYVVYHMLPKFKKEKLMQNDCKQQSLENVIEDAKSHLERIYKEALTQSISVKEESSYITFKYNKGLSQFNELLPNELMVTFIKDLGEMLEKDEVFAVVNIDGYLFQIQAPSKGIVYWEEEDKKVLFIQDGGLICMLNIE